MSTSTLAHARFDASNTTLVNCLNELVPDPAFVTWTPIKRTVKNKTKILKKPDQLTNDPTQHLTIHDALNQSDKIGLVINLSHDIIALDLDGVSLYDESIMPLLLEHPTYVEFSPSGKADHYRILYSVPKGFKHEFAHGKLILPTKDGNIEIYIRSQNYVTLTGITPPDTTIHPIAQLPLEYFNLHRENHTPLSRLLSADVEAQRQKEVEEEANTHAPLEMSDLSRKILRQVSTKIWLDTVPCNEKDQRVLRYCHKHNIDYYTYWLTGLMAIHALLGPINGLPVALEWSRRDPEKWDSEKFDATWTSFAQDPPIEGITAATYLHMYNEIAFNWPVLDTKGRPVLTNYENWRYFLDYLQVSFAIDPLSKTLLIDAPDHILYPHMFKSPQERYRQYNVSALAYAHRLSILATQYRIQLHPTEIMTHLSAMLADVETHRAPKPLLQLWLESLPDYDPKTEPDYISQLWGDCILNTDEDPKPDRETRIQIGRLWLYSLMRGLISRYKNAGAEFMIILRGPQRTGKTTFAKQLLPGIFEHLYTEVTAMTLSSRRTASSMKDYFQQISSALVVNIDEGGFFFGYNQEFSDFAKAEVTSNVLDVRLPYGRIMSKMRRLNSIILTTNDEKLALPREGSRRYMVVNMTGLDHDLYNSIPRDRLFRQALYEVNQYKEAIPPWAPPQELLDYIRGYSADHQKTTNLEELLMAIFDFSEEGFANAISALENYKGDFEDAWANMWMTAMQVRQLALDRGYNFSLKETHYTLDYLCRRYNTFLPFRFGQTTITDVKHVRRRQQLYFMPPRFMRF